VKLAAADTFQVDEERFGFSQFLMMLHRNSKGVKLYAKNHPILVVRWQS
jgi:hypothetical protein